MYLEQTSPDPDEDLCLEHYLDYVCTSNTSGSGRLVWNYSGEGGGTITFLNPSPSVIMQDMPSGLFTVSLEEINSKDGYTFLRMSATANRGILQTDDGDTVSCSAFSDVQSQTITIAG